VDIRIGEEKDLNRVGVPGHVDLAAERVIIDHRGGVLDMALMYRKSASYIIAPCTV